MGVSLGLSKGSLGSWPWEEACPLLPFLVLSF